MGEKKNVLIIRPPALPFLPPGTQRFVYRTMQSSDMLLFPRYLSVAEGRHKDYTEKEQRGRNKGQVFTRRKKTDKTAAQSTRNSFLSSQKSLAGFKIAFRTLPKAEGKVASSRTG